VRILVVCERGVSRSPTIAALLIDRGHDALAVGSETSSEETRIMLADWCQLAIFTDLAQMQAFPDLAGRFQLWSIADHYPRPHNAKLRLRVLHEIRDRRL
jgi:hypothetical protein